MGLALIPLGTRDTDLMRLLEERKLAQRRKLKEHYDKAFHGVGKTANDTLEEHIVSDTSGFTKQKALALVDRELTAADHLSFVTTAIRSAHDETALEILQGTWRQGVGAFDKLYEDWQRYVRQPGYTDYALEQAMEKELGGVHLDAAREIFVEYHKMRKSAGLQAFAPMEGHEVSAERAATRVEAATIEVGLSSGLFTSRGEVVISAAGQLRRTWAKRIKRDRTEAAVWAAQLKVFDERFRDSLGLRGADMIEARIQLRREPTFVDRVYLAFRREQYDKVVEAATDAWQAQVEGELDHELRNPPAGDPRPALSLSERVTLYNDDANTPAYEALTNRQLTHFERGAVRLELALHGLGRATKAEDLETAYRFLKGIREPGVRRVVIETYVARYMDPGGAGYGKGGLVEPARGRSGDRFVRFVEALQTRGSGYEESPPLIDLVRLLSPDASIAETQDLAERRDAATRTGLVGFYATGLVSIYDVLTAEDTQEVADDALSRLRQWVRKSRADAHELEAIMAAEGVANVIELAALGYERFAARLDEVRSVKRSVVEGVGMFVDFAGRSLLVAVLGPAGLPGLLAALGSYTAGMLVREGLLGVEYQLVSVQNLSTLVAEAATFGFDELRIEKVIKELIPTGMFKFEADSIRATEHLAKTGKAMSPGIFGPEGLSAAQAKFAQDYLKASGSKLFEKIAQDMIENAKFPTAAELLARAGHALVAAGLKPLSDKLAVAPTAFTPTAERFRENLKKIIINGPPPKAAIGYAMAKEFTDMLASPDWANTTVEQKLARLVRTGLISVASAVPVSAAFTSLGNRDASRMKRLAKSNPDVFYARLQSDPTLALAYDQYRKSVKGLPGVRAKPFDQWVAGQQRMVGAKPSVAYVAGEGTAKAEHKEIDLQKAASDAMKDMDDAMTSHGERQWGR